MAEKHIIDRVEALARDLHDARVEELGLADYWSEIEDEHPVILRRSCQSLTA